MRAAIGREFPAAGEDPALMPKLADGLRRYLAGQPVEFDVLVDWPAGSAFALDVWQACRRVAYGQTASYKSLAERIGRPGAARAVGTAMSRNPCPIVVPCHRIIANDGSLGGYSGRGGLALKRRLLEMEAAAD